MADEARRQRNRIARGTGNVFADLGLAPLSFLIQARQLTNLGQAAKNRFAKSGQRVSAGDGGPEGLASIFNKNGT